MREWTPDHHYPISDSKLSADFPIEFVVDTGFTDELCLPPEAVSIT
jgi:predicted aspartyl protease